MNKFISCVDFLCYYLHEELLRESEHLTRHDESSLNMEYLFGKTMKRRKEVLRQRWATRIERVVEFLRALMHLLYALTYVNEDWEGFFRIKEEEVTIVLYRALHAMISWAWLRRDRVEAVELVHLVEVDSLQDQHSKFSFFLRRRLLR